DDLLEVAALRRELVGHFHGRAGAHSTDDNALRLELAQPLRERPVGDLGDRPAELGEPARAGEKRPGDRPAPAPPDQLDRLLELEAEVLVVHRPSPTAARSTAARTQP